MKGIGMGDRLVSGKMERRWTAGRVPRRRWAALLAALAIAALLLAACSSAPKELGGSVPAGTGAADQAAGADLAPAPRPGHPAPDFALIDMDGKIIKLSDMRGKPVLVNFWATWCGPCRAEMPDIETVYQRHKAEGLVVLGIDVQETQEAAADYVKKGGYSWTFLMDQTGDTFLGKYRGAAFPSSFFIDRDGVIQDLSIGALNEKGFETKLGKVLTNNAQ